MDDCVKDGFFLFSEGGQVIVALREDTQLKKLLACNSMDDAVRAVSKLRYLLKYKRELEKLGVLQFQIPDDLRIETYETRGKGAESYKEKQYSIRRIPGKEDFVTKSDEPAPRIAFQSKK